MDKTILNTKIQEFINSNINSNISELLLKGVPFNDVDPKAVIEQIEAKKRSQKKLPTWFNTNNIYYPNKLNIEQTSSEITASYKANLIFGKSLIDITGGLGIDCYFFSKKVDELTHCEINEELSSIAKHNYKQLGVTNISCIKDSGIDFLENTDKVFDWIYIDPSRRDNSKQKVFLLSDCTPDVEKLQNLFFQNAKNVMIKTSPLLDFSATIDVLDYIKEIHVVAVNNEVKELLWILEKDYTKDILVKTINLQKESNQVFDFKIEEESFAIAEYSKPLNYLYEPNSAILKSGAFNSISDKLKLKKLHKHSHLYTSVDLFEFPGRSFKIEKCIDFNKKAILKEGIKKANITTRNFPISVNDIRKKFKIKDGGENYIFFTTDLNNSKIVIICSKVT
ncbi:class I SAM-dependent methyltransferase [Winogradskyella sp. SYSU M77433]|uniref:class I SAM-dependent methyltransferase n=1 Tax=Winogradskyella sp. SYSU M77433 TaxID=3042722 RepID=UPI002481477F|nr:class I SAM-dependent methyltransferase [Winogradskyella sp. SYSU M77433]MDH7912547.1 class I SAM-dependent methyltransferase [Winogradskyella sp. SYSU M77433]